jgi:predicted nucleic acid-binding protein
MAVVTNSSCLIGLERIQRLELLSQVFRSIVIPEAVQQEIGFRAAFLNVQVVKNQNLVVVLKSQVDDGEAEAIALAQEISATYLVLDDGKARKLAK